MRYPFVDIMHHCHASTLCHTKKKYLDSLKMEELAGDKIYMIKILNLFMNC